MVGGRLQWTTAIFGCRAGLKQVQWQLRPPPALRVAWHWPTLLRMREGQPFFLRLQNGWFKNKLLPNFWGHCCPMFDPYHIYSYIIIYLFQALLGPPWSWQDWGGTPRCSQFLKDPILGILSILALESSSHWRFLPQLPSDWGAVQQRALQPGLCIPSGKETWWNMTIQNPTFSSMFFHFFPIYIRVCV